MMNKYLIILMLNLSLIYGQDLRGRWTNTTDIAEDVDYFILDSKEGNTYKGTSFDSNSDVSFCHYTFILKQDPNSDYCLAKDDKLIEKSEDHSPVGYKLHYSREGDDEYLTGEGFIIDGYGISAPFPVKYHKITNDPTRANPPKKVEPQVTDNQKNEVKQLKASRSNNRKALINVDSETIKINVYDYGKEDHDSITIFLNDEVIAYKIPIENSKKTYTLKINPDKVNDLTFVANNLGDIPPNTTQVEILADDKVFNYTLFTTLSQNAVIQLRLSKD